MEIAVNAVKYARSLGCEDIEFSPEDAGRSDPEFLYRILSAVVEAGATTLNIPDAAGICLPEEFGQLIAGIKANVKGIEGAVISTHCQNDLGLSTANSLAGVANGARQVECTINGIGERAGNASLEEVAMSIYMRGQSRLMGAYTGINPVHIYPISQMVKTYSGMAIQPHKAIVGANAFAHESGIHQDGMLKNKLTYEIIAPEQIGYFRGEDDCGVVMGKHSGRHALSSKLNQLGIPLEGAQLDDVFNRFKLVAETKLGGVNDDELLAIVRDGESVQDPAWSLETVQVVCGTTGLPTATVRMQSADGTTHVSAVVGTGPVDAAFKAIDAVVGLDVVLTEYRVTAVTKGINSLAETTINIKPREGAEQKLGSDVFKTNLQTGETAVRSFTATGAEHRYRGLLRSCLRHRFEPNRRVRHQVVHPRRSRRLSVSSSFSQRDTPSHSNLEARYSHHVIIHVLSLTRPAPRAFRPRSPPRVSRSMSPLVNPIRDRDRHSASVPVMSTYVYVDADGGGTDRKAVQRRTVDYTATTVRYVEERVYAKDPWDSPIRARCPARCWISCRRWRTRTSRRPRSPPSSCT